MAKVSALVTTALQVHRCELAIFVYSEVGKTATVMHFNFLTLKFNKTPPIVRTYTNINKVNKKNSKLYLSHDRLNCAFCIIKCAQIAADVRSSSR